MRTLSTIFLVLCNVSLFILPLASASSSFGLNYDWRFSLSSQAPSKCSLPDPFPIDASKQCMNLNPALYASSASTCLDACCSDDTCEIWQWCDGNDECGEVGCWIGKKTDCNDNNGGWVGGFRDTLPPPPTPSSTCNATITPECAKNYDDSTWRILEIPHDYVVEGEVDEEKGDMSHGYLPVGVGWYRKYFKVPAEMKDNQEIRSLAYLQFEGIMGAVEIYLNGIFVASKSASYTPLRYEVSDFLNYDEDGENVIAVKVDGSDTDSWWYDGGGLYRTASITFSPKIHLAQYGVYAPALVDGDIIPESPDSPAKAKCALPATVEVECHQDDCGGEKVSIKYSVLEVASNNMISKGSVSNELAPATTTTTLDLEVTLEEPLNLWSIAHPSLYMLTTMLQDDEGNVLDESNVKFGCRKAEFDANKGFFLNDVPTKILGVANHQDLPVFGVAVPDSLQDHRVMAMQAFGANAWRTAHNCPSSALLESTDKLGMLVWDENHKNGQTEEAATLVRRDRNHPSIIIWSICNEALCNADGLGNESPGSMSAAREIIDTYHNLDPLMGRLVSSNQNGWNTNSSFLDLIGVDYAVETYDAVHNLVPEKPIISSETSSAVSDRGETFNDYDNGIVQGYDTEAPSWGSTAQDSWGGVDVKASQGILTRDFVSGGFTWTGWDYKGEPTPTSWPTVSSHFGIIDSAGFWKDRTYWYKAWWKRDQDLYIFPRWTGYDEGEAVTIWAFSDLPEVELFVNSVSAGRKKMPTFAHVSWETIFEPGELEVRGYENVGDKEPAKTFTLETAGEPVALRASIMDGVGTDGLSRDGSIVGKVMVEVIDDQGRLVPFEDERINVKFSASKNSIVVGCANGNPNDHDPDVADRRDVYHGSVMAFIKVDRLANTNEGDKVEVTVEAEGLKSDVISFTVVDQVDRGGEI